MGEWCSGLPKLQNIHADTNMRKSIADGGAPDSGATPAAGATQSTS
jgi:hypothetical protein